MYFMWNIGDPPSFVIKTSTVYEKESDMGYKSVWLFTGWWKLTFHQFFGFLSSIGIVTHQSHISQVGYPKAHLNLNIKYDWENSKVSPQKTFSLGIAQVQFTPFLLNSQSGPFGPLPPLWRQAMIVSLLNMNIPQTSTGWFLDALASLELVVSVD